MIFSEEQELAIQASLESKIAEAMTDQSLPPLLWSVMISNIQTIPVHYQDGSIDQNGSARIHIVVDIAKDSVNDITS